MATNPLYIRCPWCYAVAGSPCMSSHKPGEGRPRSPHNERVRMANDVASRLALASRAGDGACLVVPELGEAAALDGGDGKDAA